jgi:alpha-mannosidase
MLLTFAALLCLAPADDVNVALAKWGATARASSVYGPGYEAAGAIDGRWQSRETDKWNSAANVTPHWLILDLARAQPLHRIVIRHEGVVGEGERYNTSDFQLQRGDGPDGPWTDLVPPIVGNHDDLTTHEFAATPVRWLRLLITVGEQGGRNEFARIFELEAYARRAELTAPLLAAEPRPRWRTVDGQAQQEVAVETVGAPAGAVVSGDGRQAPLDAEGRAVLWLPVGPRTLTLTGGVSREVTVRPPTDLGASFAETFRHGTVWIINSSHQDIAWMDTIERCIAQRDHQVVTPALERLAAGGEFKFVMEDTLSLMEYLQRHPERRDEIAKWTREGRLEWGGTYNEPYEGLLSGEELVRQVYYGRRWLRAALPGCDTRVAWSPDVPGRALQMPQILVKSGIPYMVISRMEKGFYNWKSPDGSSLLVWTPGHYCDSWGRLSGPLAKVAANVAADTRRWEPYYQAHQLPADLVYDVETDSSSPVDLTGLLHDWPQPPELRYGTSAQFLDTLAPARGHLPTVSGERPNVWLYIHGPSHHALADAKRAAARLLPAAEAFSYFAETLGAPLPPLDWQAAWRHELFPDHGMGGYYGELTDAAFRRHCETARDTAEQRLTEAQTRIAANIASPQPSLVVFNDLSWSRSDVVRATLPRNRKVVDAAGHDVPCQVIPSAADDPLTIEFVATDVPAMGYRSYGVVPGTVLLPVSRLTPTDRIENDFYRIDLRTGGGLKSLFDKQLGRELLKAGKWLGGELFTMQSVGNGAGEFATVQQPTMEEFDHLGRWAPPWKVVEDGLVRTVAELTLPQEAQQFRHCTVVQRLIAYHAIKRLDLETELRGWDGTPYREFRLAFPMNLTNAQVSYEVPMGVTRVGRDELSDADGKPIAAGERYTQVCREARPREVQNWFDASDAAGGLTVSTSTAVFDWVDPTDTKLGYPVLQPLLLASRRSCHGLGNWYLQPGDHAFRCSLFGHAGDWRQGWRAGLAANHPLRLVTTAARADGALPASLSFVDLQGPGLLLTACKRAEDDDSLVLRLVEMEGQDATAAIRLWRPAASVQRANLIEDPSGEAQPAGEVIRLKVGHHAIESVKVRLK